MPYSIMTIVNKIMILFTTRVTARCYYNFRWQNPRDNNGSWVHWLIQMIFLSRGFNLKKRASWNFKVDSSFVITSTLTQRQGNTVHIRLIHAETSSPKGYKFMVGFEAQKMRNPPSATQLIPNVADYDMSQM